MVKVNAHYYYYIFLASQFPVKNKFANQSVSSTSDSITKKMSRHDLRVSFNPVSTLNGPKCAPVVFH